jgi:hypothetical protein
MATIVSCPLDEMIISFCIHATPLRIGGDSRAERAKHMQEFSQSVAHSLPIRPTIIRRAYCPA